MLSLWLLKQCCGTYVAMLLWNVVETFSRVARKGRASSGKCEWEEEVHTITKITKQTKARIYFILFLFSFLIKAVSRMTHSKTFGHITNAHYISILLYNRTFMYSALAFLVQPYLGDLSNFGLLLIM